MRLSVEITDTKANVMRVYRTGWKGPFSAAIWSEGNYSCDCNRSLFFNYASGDRKPHEGFQEACNVGPNRFTVVVRDAQDEILYQD